MIKLNKQTNADSDDNMFEFKYLRSSMRKIVSSIKLTVLLLTLMLFNIGAKFPVKSEEVATTPSVESSEMSLELESARLEAERYMKMYEEIYKRSVIQQIELESEVIIPSHFDFKYVEYVYKISSEIGIPPRVMFRLIFKESTFNTNALSRVGAKGLMQLMPETRSMYYKKFCVDTLNLDKIQEDIYIGAYYIKELQEFWRERGNAEKNLLKLSLAAYNAGPERVKQYKGVPPFKETQDFVTFILKPHSNPPFYANVLKKSIVKEMT